MKPPPPTTGEVWSDRTNGRRAVVRDTKRGIVELTWLDDNATERRNIARFTTELDIVLANDDYLDAIPIRRTTLIDNYKAVFESAKSVLELGAHTGAFTERMARYAPRVTAIENSVRCVVKLQRAIRKQRDIANRVRIVRGDAHRLLFELSPRTYDVIVCAGLLYHSASPFLLLEGMARLAPQKILIDTLDSRVKPTRILVERAPLNAINFRYNDAPQADCGMSCVIGSALITAAMARMGYDLTERIDKSALEIEPKEKDSPYFHDWKESFSGWFTRRVVTSARAFTPAQPEPSADAHESDDAKA